MAKDKLPPTAGEQKPGISTTGSKWFIVIVMEKNQLSILHQKAKGTRQRNEQIRKLATVGENYAAIGRMFKISRQAVRKIVSQP